AASHWINLNPLNLDGLNPLRLERGALFRGGQGRSRSVLYILWDWRGCQSHFIHGKGEATCLAH
ncbi:hypothetical protein, partial [Vibrio cholerae]|uniref:hypothetical protein n=1 Tax=Vibrio cholerae TaxID=666 RepID=UPI001E55A631